MLTINGQARELTIPGVAPPPVDELERILQQAMTKLLAHPAEAVSVGLDVKDDGPTLVLSSVGTRPVTVRLIDDDGRVTLRGSVVLMSEQGEMYGSEVLSPDAVSALMREGVLTAGRAPLAPGASVRIGLPKPGGAPATGPLVLAGGLDLEMESAGVLRPVSVQAKTVPLRR
jgi:hypothetical protein